MKHTCVDTSRHITSQYTSQSKKVRISPDYFGEALRILDNDKTIELRREHVAALWGLVVGLTRRLTEALVECQDERSRNAPCREGRQKDRRLQTEGNKGLLAHTPKSLQPSV